MRQIGLDFSKVILGDKIELGLIGQASTENLIGKDTDSGSIALSRRSRKKQEALAFLVLFDKLIISNLVGGRYSIPSLEDKNILKVLNVTPKLVKDFAGTGWLENRDPNVFLKCLNRTTTVRPLILNYLARNRIEFPSYIAKATKESYKKVINEIINFAHAHYSCDEDGIKKNLFSSILDDQLIKDIRKNLTVQTESNFWNPIDVILLGAFHAGALLESYMELSMEHKAGVATFEFLGSSHLWNNCPISQRKLENIGNDFLLLRTSLHEEMTFFPRIDGISHALRLKKDPNIKAFRKQLSLFQNSIIKGDASDLTLLRREVKSAAQALSKISSSRRKFSWLTYLTIPATALESIFIGLPIMSLSISVPTIGFNVYDSVVSKKNKWILFGGG